MNFLAGNSVSKRRIIDTLSKFNIFDSNVPFDEDKSTIEVEFVAIEPEQTIPKRESLFEKTALALRASTLVYLFADLAKIARDDKEKLLDLDPTIRAAFDSGDTACLFPQSLSSLEKIVLANKKFLENKHTGDLEYTVWIRDFQKVEGQSKKDTIYLEAFDSLYQGQGFVYGIVRDDNTKTITVTFRGSSGIQVWFENFQKRMVEMRIPNLLQKIMDDDNASKGAKYVHVHQGFYNCLFNDNIDEDGKQQYYDQVCEALRRILKLHHQYKVVVTGNHLGAALATLVAFKLAGSEKSWLPRPVTCISFESPCVGYKDFAEAFGILEREGFLRHLLVTHQEDIVPTLVMDSILAYSAYDHVGMHLNLFAKDYEISYPSCKRNWLKRILYANVIHNVGFPWNMVTYDNHETALVVEERIHTCRENLVKLRLEDLYRDDCIIGDLYKKKSR
eukprot:CAMPEP_0195284268 /NCGR_PEP_ID=MMETSP0707-20130614/2528_1 /TAXON_ID=33640 /ORGANISM="Asterionellopsis glacialis, Strain CCMP134" /LENGTH=446 /DNA_ID=CAMNT_0040343587 /DNA_START=19 /DNA_END=1356 /DNA_ORIENTATION=+